MRPCAGAMDGLAVLILGAKAGKSGVACRRFPSKRRAITLSSRGFMDTALSAQPLGNVRKQQLRAQIEAGLDEAERWRKTNAAYHADDLKFMRFLIPPGKRVLELGCGTGELLASLEPSHGVGIDFAPAALERARARYPHLSFVLGDAEDQATLEQIEGPFDYIVIADTIGMWEDIDATLRLGYQRCTPSTRVILAHY